MRCSASLSLSSAPTWTTHPGWSAAGLMAAFCWTASGCDIWGRGAGSAKANVCGAGAAGTLDAGSTPSRRFPVPWFAGWGGRSVLAMSGLLASALLVSALLVSALATTALEVSGTSGCAAGIALVMGGAGCAAPADASFSCPALTWTVLTLTGFIGSDEPGMAAMAWVWITPEVSGAGSGLGCGGGTAAGASTMIDPGAGAFGRNDGAAPGPRGAGATARASPRPAAASRTAVM